MKIDNGEWDRFHQIKNHAKEGGYLYVHIQQDILFLTEMISELRRRQFDNPNYKGKIDTGV